MQNKQFPFLFLLLAFPLFSIAQGDSVRTMKYTTMYNTEYYLDRNTPFRYEDTVINRNELYHPMYRRNEPFRDLGNIGSASQPVFFSWYRKTDFSTGFNPYDYYNKKPEFTRYYVSKKPYADFKYTQGKNELLLFSGKFTMNLTPRLNMGIDYDRITSDGFYPRQKTSQYHTSIFSSYFSRNNRYGLLANVIRNRGINNESGGNLSDSLFETLTGTNKAVASKLTGSQGRFRNFTVYAKQYFYLGSIQQSIEDEDTLRSLTRSGFISHTFRYDKDQLFFDNSTGDTSYLFPTAGLDSTGIFYDSIATTTLMNRVAYTYWTKSTPEQQSFIEFAISHKYIHVTQMDYSNTYQNVLGEATMERIPYNQKNIGFKLFGSYCFTGYNRNDFKVSAEVKLLTKIGDFTGSFTNQLLTPDYTFMHFHSLPFSWDNSFKKTNVLNWKAALSTRKFKNNFTLNYNQFIITNWVYNGTSVSPEQSNKVILLHTLDLTKTIQAGKWFFFEHKLMAQKANIDIIRLPEFAANLRYYVSGPLFKKALYLQCGAELFYNSAYYGNAWNPSARVFYLQNDTKIGNYPMLDFFISGQMMTMVIYAKLEHANMDWMNSGFYYTPNYPLPVRVFRLGIRLRLYN